LERLLLGRACIQQDMHVQDLINSCLPSPGEADTTAVEQQQQQQSRPFVTAAGGSQLFDGMDRDRQQEVLLAAQRSMPDLLQREAELIVQGACWPMMQSSCCLQLYLTVPFHAHAHHSKNQTCADCSHCSCIVAVLFASVQRSDVLASVAALFAEALAAASCTPGGMGRLAALDIEQHVMSSSAQAACASSAPFISATGSLGYVMTGPTGDHQ
jgi:hypothetical protein